MTTQISLFKKPVFVKQLGIIIPGESISPYLGITVKMQRKFKLVEPSTITDELYIDSDLVVRFSVTAELSKDALYIAKGANVFNQKLRDRTEAAFNPPAAEIEEAPKRRRRSTKVEEVEEEKPVVNYDDFISTRAYNFGVLQLNVTDATIPLIGSDPYEAVAKLSEKNEEAINNKIGSLRAHINRITTLRNKLRAPDKSSIEDAMGGLVRSDNELAEIDSAGLDNYENSLRRDITNSEEAVRSIYAWINEKIVARSNPKEDEWATYDFKGSVTIGTTTTTLSDIITAMKEEVFIEVDL